MNTTDGPIVPTEQLIAEMAAIPALHRVLTILAELRRRGISVDEAGRRVAFHASADEYPSPRTAATGQSSRRYIPNRPRKLNASFVIGVALAIAIVAVVVWVPPRPDAAPPVTSRAPNVPPVNVQPPTGTEWVPPRSLKPSPTRLESVDVNDIVSVLPVAPRRLPVGQRVNVPVEPTRTPEEPVRLESGHEWNTTGEAQGHGELTVRNGNSEDGVAILFARDGDALRPRRAMYVRGGEEAVFHGIGPKSYTLRFMLGVDWDEAERTFRRNVECHEFTEPLTFEEYDTEDSDSRVHHFAAQSVTLHRVRNGNAPSRTVNRSALRFNELVREP